MDKKYKTLEKSQLQSLVERLAWNRNFGCYTKNGFEDYIWPDIAPYVKWIIFFDLDYLHDLNDKLGRRVVDGNIKQVLSIVRDTDYVAGQKDSGDEFLICSKEREGETSDPEKLKNRIIEEMNKFGMSATFAIVKVSTWDLAEAVAPAEDEVKRLKAERGIGR